MFHTYIVTDRSCKVLFRLNNLLYDISAKVHSCNWLGLSSETSFFLSYCSTVNPTENPVVSFFAIGEGWHNYHHSFPWDYKAAELGFYRLNPTTAFIDFMAWLGWAYDLKTSNAEIIDRLCANKGDGTTGLSRDRKDISEISHIVQ